MSDLSLPTLNQIKQFTPGKRTPIPANQIGPKYLPCVTMTFTPYHQKLGQSKVALQYIKGVIKT